MDLELIPPLVKRFDEHQKTLGLSNRAYAARYKKFLGSEKAWTAMQNGEFNGYLKPERVLKNLQDFARFLEAAQAFDPDEFVAELPFIKRANLGLERLLASGGDRHCLPILAPEGIGKSWWASYACKEDASNRFYLRLSSTWREKPMHIASGMAARLHAAPAKNPAKQIEEVIKKLNERPGSILFIDEGHNGGVAVLKLIKDLIDETPARFVYMAFPTEFDLVRNSSLGAVAEARQFIRRCIRPVFDDYRAGIRPTDIIAYLRARGFGDTGELKSLAGDLAPLLAKNQNLSTLADALELSRDEAEAGDKPCALAAIRENLHWLISSADQRTKSDV